MGIAVKELLELDYFKDFRVIAGSSALYKRIQGIAIMDSPDAFRSSTENELFLTGGYAISQDPDCIRRAFQEGSILGCSALMIRQGCYLDSIPADMVMLFEQFNIPLISMPSDTSFSDVQKQVRSVLINRVVRRFQLDSENNFLLPKLSYKEQKILRILETIEKEMHFSACLYDIYEEKSYYSSESFKTIGEYFGLNETDYWTPSREVARTEFCDHSPMIRCRLIDNPEPNGLRISWILTPVTVNNAAVAYFVVMEVTDPVDHYDEYPITIAYLQLQSIYEQLIIADNVGDIGFENYVLFALNSREEDAGQLIYQVRQHGLSTDARYSCILFSQTNSDVSARSMRRRILSAFRQCSFGTSGKLVFLEENEGIILLEVQDGMPSPTDSMPSPKGDIPSPKGGHGPVPPRSIIAELEAKLSGSCPELHFDFAFSADRLDLTELKPCIGKCRNILRMGRIVYPDEHIWDYDTLGPLTWLNIPENEIRTLLSSYQQLLEDPANVDPLKTLKVYLENNMNFSTTATLMNAHINTIRKRIDHINEILDIGWEDYYARLKTQLILQMLGL